MQPSQHLRLGQAMRQSLLFALTLLCAACGPDAFQVAGLPPPGVQKLDLNIAPEGYLTSAGADCVERNLKPGARISIALDDGDADALIRVARHLESVGGRIHFSSSAWDGAMMSFWLARTRLA